MSKQVSQDKKKKGIFGRIRSKLSKSAPTSPLPNPEPTVRATPLLEAMLNNLDLQDIETLCQRLNVEYSGLAGGKGRKISAFMQACERRKNLPDLLAACQTLKPTVDWQKEW